MRIAVSLFSIESASIVSKSYCDLLLGLLAQISTIPIDVVAGHSDRDCVLEMQALKDSERFRVAYYSNPHMALPDLERNKIHILCLPFPSGVQIVWPVATLEVVPDPTEVVIEQPQQIPKEQFRKMHFRQLSIFRSTRILVFDQALQTYLQKDVNGSKDKYAVAAPLTAELAQTTATHSLYLRLFEDAIKAYSPPVRIEEVRQAPRFSIVSPSYNQAHFIRKTIDSVLSQSYPHIEYKILDGASADTTLEVLKSYGSRLKWISEKDTGYASAVNKGFENANGDYLLWLPSDDIYFDSKSIERIANAVLQGQRPDVVFGEAYYIDERDTILGSYNTESYTADLLRDWCFIAQPSTAFKRDLFKKVGGLNEDLKCIADYDLWLRFSEAGASFCRINAPISMYRLHSDSKTTSQRLQSFLEIFELQLDRYGVVSPSWYEGALREVISRLRGQISEQPAGVYGESHGVEKAVMNGSEQPRSLLRAMRSRVLQQALSLTKNSALSQELLKQVIRYMIGCTKRDLRPGLASNLGQVNV